MNRPLTEGISYLWSEVFYAKAEGIVTTSNSPTNRLLLNAVSRIDDLLRDTVGRRDFPSIILPCVLLRRLECVLEPTREAVHTAFISGATDGASLTSAAGYYFYNTSLFDFPLLCSDPANLQVNMQSYLDGWSSNVRSLLSPFDFEHTIEQLAEGHLLTLLIQEFAALELYPEIVSSQDMSNLFEELLRRCFGSASYPGEYFSPPEVASLMARLLIEEDNARPIEPSGWTVYDPCCGTGRLLFAFRDYFQKLYPDVQLALYGQELNPQSLALCKADLYMSNSPDDAERMVQGSTLANDHYANMTFHRMLANPPYGKSWVADRTRVVAEAKRGESGRFGAGIPKVSDGQMLFLQHLLSHMKEASQGGSRIAMLSNGSPLFNGDAGSGESEIRRRIFEQDWLEAIIALPDALFYNTSIATYLWLLTNCKSEQRRGKIQLIDARNLWVPIRRNLGEKRRLLTDSHCSQVISLLRSFEENDISKICDNTVFGYRRIIVDRPLHSGKKVLPQPDPDLRDVERVPLSESIWSFFEREVKPYVPDAWINTQIRDHKDHQIGQVGYEINFTRMFYRYQPLRSIEEIMADIKRLEAESASLLRDILGT